MIPGSKSLTNRALIMAALANGKTKVSGILKSDDSYWCIDTLKKLGIKIEIQNDRAYIEGKGENGILVICTLVQRVRLQGFYRGH